jgi:hypothetical protein
MICAMSSATYDTDILEWSEEQATALRKLARRRPDLSNELDWENVAEEIECVGRSEFAAVRSYIRQILIHIIKGVSAPDSDSMRHWRAEATTFHDDLLDRISPSMLTRIDLDAIWTRAVNRAETDLSDYGRPIEPHLPARCPITITAIVDREFDFFKIVESVRKQINDGRTSA